MTKVQELAETIAWLSSNDLYELSKELVDHYGTVANLLQADIDYVQDEKKVVDMNI